MVTNKGGVGTARTKLWLYDGNAHFRQGHELAEDLSVLAEGESKKITFRVPLDFHGMKTLRVDELSVELEVPRIDASEYVRD